MNKEDMEKVQIYFEAALAVPAEKRNAFLAETCGEEIKIRHQVEALLKADSQSKIWDSDEPFDITLEQTNTFQAGDEIGHYSIIEQIGEGGMGVIYKAHDKKLQRHVALKFLPVSMNSDAHIRQRFLAEARAASQLDHPNICVIHDVSETPNGQLYITMPCYEGETLAKRITRGSIAQIEAVDITIQVAQGLACAHANKIVHRDIKPANIMLTHNAGVKVLDFGIAKVENIHLTQTGMNIGTLAYMSPEQLRGEAIDARTDIWALGVVLFEALTGKQAFPAKALTGILQSVLNETDSTVETLANKLPSSLYRVLQNAMSRDLQNRFVTINDMLNALIEARHEAGMKLIQNPATQGKTFINHDITKLAPGYKKPRPYQWDEQLLEKIANIMLPLLGPIAPKLVQRSAKIAADLNQLSQLLAEAFPDKNSREYFIKQMETQISAFTTPPAPRALKTDGSLAGIDLSATQLAAIEAELIGQLGPIAQTLIRRHAVNASSLLQLFDTLAQHLGSDKDKQIFLQKMVKLLETN